MLHRIAWTEPARPRGAEDVELAEDDDDDNGNERGENGNAEGGAGADAGEEEGKGKGKAKASASAAEGGEGEGPAGSLEDNRCWLIWEGTLRERLFSGFKARSCPTEREAKELLGDMKGYWDMAKNWKGEEEELF